MPGPAPSRFTRRNGPRGDFRKLPAGGRTGSPPAFPLEDQTPAEVDRWASLWALPQAVMWEELHIVRVGRDEGPPGNSPFLRAR